MSSITTRTYKRHRGLNFLEEIANSSVNNYYFYVSKPTQWTDENAPDEAKDTRESELEVWDNIISLKKVQSSDAVFVIPRFDWDATQLTIYKPYDSRDKDLYNHPTAQEVLDAATQGTYKAGSFYCMNSQSDIYICIDNSRNSRSLYEPTGRAINPFTLFDGYTWKYICSVSDSDRTKFLTSEFLPVRNLTEDDGSYQWSVQQTSIDGAIESFIVDAPGSGYASTSGAVVSGTSNTVTLANTANASVDYYVGMTMHLSTGERAKVIAYSGISRIATLDKNLTVIPTTDHEYTILPTIEITGDGIGAVCKPLVVGGLITNIIVISKGTGYSHATVQVVDTIGENASIRANIGYRNGLSFDPLVLLGATTVCINMRIAFDELGFFSDNDYRIFGLLKNVKNTLDNEISTISNAKGTIELAITGKYGDIPNDGILQLSNGTKVRVVSSDTNSIDIIQDSVTGWDEIIKGNVKAVDDSGGATITDIILPTIQKYSGELLFISTREAIQRSEEQLEDFKLFFKF